MSPSILSGAPMARRLIFAGSPVEHDGWLSKLPRSAAGLSVAIDLGIGYLRMEPIVSGMRTKDVVTDLRGQTRGPSRGAVRRPTCDSPPLGSDHPLDQRRRRVRDD